MVEKYIAELAMYTEGEVTNQDYIIITSCNWKMKKKTGGISKKFKRI